MTRPAAVAALAALAAVAAIIAADLTAPASAQSDGGTTGRIVARLLDDGRVEFGWQPADGERILPRKRIFPTDARVDRWLSSSPVEVAGAAIGKINARRLSGGRIEFAFTPTDAERILPRLRYFPADARVGRWVRSAELTISPPQADAPRYTAVSAYGNRTCGLRVSGEIVCWGGATVSRSRIRNYTAVSVGLGHACAMLHGGTILNGGPVDCWGSNRNGATESPPDLYTAVTAGDTHSCAIRLDDGGIDCWGWNGYRTIDPNTGESLIHEPESGRIDAPPGSYTAVSAGVWHTCAIRANGELACWGNPDHGQTHAPPGNFTTLSAGPWHSCAIRASGELACWGVNGYHHYDAAEMKWLFTETSQADAPDGNFTAVSAGWNHTCAIHTNGRLECWGSNDTGQANAPNGIFTAVAAGWAHTCAIRPNGHLECWGSNTHNQTTPPPN